MKIEMVKVADLKGYERNAKAHPSEQVERIAKSISAFGFKQPVVVDKDNVLIAGHGRIEAAKFLKLKEVPAIRADDLTPEAVKAFRLADNKTAESEWLEDVLQIELAELGEMGWEMEEFGFEEEMRLPVIEMDADMVDVLLQKLVKCPGCKMVFDARGHELRVKTDEGNEK